MLLGHEADATSPVGRGVVEHVVHVEAVTVLARELIELLLEEDVVMVHVGVDERELGTVQWVLKGRADDLEHRCDAGSASNHTNFAREGRVVLELALRTLNSNLVADFEKGDVSRDVTLLVCLERHVDNARIGKACFMEGVEWK